jgi:hypothetical protein
MRGVRAKLNPPKIASFQAAFPAEQARALARQLECHYPPQHGSWLNSAEIELAVLSNRCLSQRLPDKEALRREVKANMQTRNPQAMPGNWRFTAQDARRQLARLYPCVST